REVVEGRSMPVSDLIDLVQWLPPECALGRDMGGPPALSDLTREVRRAVYWLRVLDYRERGSKGEKPKPDPEPQWAHERRAEADVMTRKAAAYMRRQRR